MVCLYVTWVLWPASVKAFWYSSLALLKIVSLLDILDSRDSMDWGILLMMVGGWFDSTWTYWWVSPGLEYGLYSFLCKSNVTSRKSVTVELAVVVI